MPRNLKPHETQKRSQARRAHALQRLNLREPSSPRVTAAGPTSHAVKVVDDATRAAIEAFERRMSGKE